MSEHSELNRRRFDELMDQLRQERVRATELRVSYARVIDSRFHALRMLWFSLKALVGLRSPTDVYAAWSPGLASLPALAPLPASEAPGFTVHPATRQLAEMWSHRARARAQTDAIAVSIVIPVFNNREVTIACLKSIAQTWFESLSVEFIVVDDGSTDGTFETIVSLAGVVYVRSGRNEGFVRACNRGAALAKGKYICFLNNDTMVCNGWLDYLVMVAENDASIGVVGSKLVYPDGRLQEAGSILWRDATGWNYGRFERADDPRYNFLRDVDYVSGAAMLVRAELFRRLGGFSELYAPAYYEDADFCQAVHAAGFRVVYQPLSEVVHFEGLTAGDEASGTKRFQEINRPKFREKWSATLQAHFPNKHSNVFAAARRRRTGQVVLVVDSYVPLYDKEAGSLRLSYVVKILRDLGYSVVFLPDNYAGLQPYTRELQQMGVEVLHHIDAGRTMEESLDAILPHVDVAWISRPDLYAKYEPLIRRNESTLLIYDTVDLAHVRRRREEELQIGGTETWQELQQLELRAARSADATVVVTEDERRAMHELGVRNVHVVPTMHEPAGMAGPLPFSQTSGLLFIGSYNHPPNVDAAQWLVRDVMPIVWKDLPGIQLTLAGSNPSDQVLELRSERVRVPGSVQDVAPYFRDARIFVAPLRFGAGMKGKIGHALTFGLPVITTEIGAEGFDLRDGENALIVSPDAAQFASAIVSAYRDEELWHRLSVAASAAIAPFSPKRVRTQLEALFASLERRDLVRADGARAQS